MRAAGWMPRASSRNSPMAVFASVAIASSRAAGSADSGSAFTCAIRACAVSGSPGSGGTDSSAAYSETTAAIRPTCGPGCGSRRAYARPTRSRKGHRRDGIAAIPASRKTQAADGMDPGRWLAGLTAAGAAAMVDAHRPVRQRFSETGGSS